MKWRKRETHPGSGSVKPWLLPLCFLSSKGLVSGACHLCAGEFLKSCSQEILREDSHLVLFQIAPLTTHLGLHLVGQILEKFYFLPFKSWNLIWQTVGPENEGVRGLVAFLRVLPWARPSVSMSFLGFWLQSDDILGIHQKGNLPRRVLWTFGGNSLRNDSDDGQFNRSSWKSDSSPHPLHPVQFSWVAQLSPTLCDPMNRSTPGLPVHHQFPESTQTHVHCVGDAIQPSHPLLSPSPPTLNLSQHQGLFKWVSSPHQVAKVLEFQLQHQSLQWTPRTGWISFQSKGLSTPNSR